MAYQCVRRNLTGLLRHHDGAGGHLVPACPGWSVRDTVAHLVEICRLTEGNLALRPADRPALDHDLSQLDLGALLTEWERSGSQLEISMARPENARKGAVMVMDAFTHELDIRYALASSIPVAHPAFPVAFQVVISGLNGSIISRGLPALRLETSGVAWTAGDGEPAAVVSAPRLALYRSLAGRRTYRQLEQLSWTADPARWLPAFTWGPFRPPDQPAE
jgi:uncharacterized protein (TIGR03083 family)